MWSSSRSLAPRINRSWSVICLLYRSTLTKVAAHGAAACAVERFAPACAGVGGRRAGAERGSADLVDTFAKLRRERKGVEWAREGVNSPMSSSEKQSPCWRAVVHAVWRIFRASNIPIVVIAINYDPVGRGYAAILAHPGGDPSGVFFRSIELAGKQVELLKQMVPRAAGEPLDDFVGCGSGG